MKRRLLALRACALLGLTATSMLGDVTPQDTVGPNRFEFTQAEYVVAEDAGAVIWVRLHPGHRGISGGVAYRTEDGTAIADEDYLPVAASLYFSGWANRSFSVPIIWDSLDFCPAGKRKLALKPPLLCGSPTSVRHSSLRSLRRATARSPFRGRMMASRGFLKSATHRMAQTGPPSPMRERAPRAGCR